VTGALLIAALLAADLRSVVLLRYDCRAKVDRSEVTLFANGTLRVRSGPPGAEQLFLFESGAAEVTAWRHRLDEIDLSEGESPNLPIAGDWLERCELEVRQGERPPRTFRFGRFDTLTGGLFRVKMIAEELLAQAREKSAPAGLPHDYKPRPNDCLQRIGGGIFRLLGSTMDGKGLELEGIDVPLTILTTRQELPRLFAAVVACP